jgi:hypothetical protein
VAAVVEPSAKISQAIPSQILRPIFLAKSEFAECCSSSSLLSRSCATPSLLCASFLYSATSPWLGAHHAAAFFPPVSTELRAEQLSANPLSSPTCNSIPLSSPFALVIHPHERSCHTLYVCIVGRASLRGGCGYTLSAAAAPAQTSTHILPH